jgi:hypothetical protein
MDWRDGFDDSGYLGEGSASYVPTMRGEIADWFALADDVNKALMRLAAFGTNAAKTSAWNPKAVAVRALLRSCGTFQGVILLTERGMVAEGRTLTRSLIEDAFAIAALNDKPDEFVKMLKNDSDESRRLQAKFMTAEQLVTDPAARDKLKVALDKMEKADILSPKKVASMGPLLKQYLSYQRLSDDAAHLSAKSLDRHVHAMPKREGWHYKVGPGSAGENAATLHHAVLAALPIGIGITQMLGEPEGNKYFSSLAERFHVMPPVQVI